MIPRCLLPASFSRSARAIWIASGQWPFARTTAARWPWCLARGALRGPSSRRGRTGRARLGSGDYELRRYCGCFRAGRDRPLVGVLDRHRHDSCLQRCGGSAATGVVSEKLSIGSRGLSSIRLRLGTPSRPRAFTSISSSRADRLVIEMDASAELGPHDSRRIAEPGDPQARVRRPFGRIGGRQWHRQ